MTNFEKYKDLLKQIADSGKSLFLKERKPTAIDPPFAFAGCDSRTLRWLLAEYKEPVKLSTLAKEVLKRALIIDRYKYLARNADGVLYLHVYKPQKAESNWITAKKSWHVGVFADDFPFVKWEDAEPWSIEELLKGAEQDD